MADRTRSRAAGKESGELPETVTLYPDPHHIIQGVPHDVVTLPREKAQELLAYGRHDSHGKPAWDGEPFAPAFHLVIQQAVFESQVGPDAPQFADPPDPATHPADQAADERTPAEQADFLESLNGGL